MTTAKVFENGRSQAVRLPKECRFDTPEVCVARMDDMVILYPPGKGWEMLEKGLATFTADFMTSRRQPKARQRRRKL